MMQAFRQLMPLQKMETPLYVLMVPSPGSSFFEICADLSGPSMDKLPPMLRFQAFVIDEGSNSRNTS